jgi:hypothetical protein
VIAPAAPDTALSGVMSVSVSSRRPPAWPLWLGLAGLLPQLLALFPVIGGNPDARFIALACAFAYAALILSFLGGMWWGLAAAKGRVPPWIWIAAVLPSLIAFASAYPWMVGQPWPGPSLIWLGLAIIGSLGVDWRLRLMGVAPDWWMSLRIPLSIGLGGMTLAIAWL